MVTTGSGGFPCSLAKAIRRWIVDSGSCFRLVGLSTMSPRDKREIGKTDEAYSLATANGTVVVNKDVAFKLTPGGDPLTALAMNDSPSVLFLGRLCMLHGFAFTWLPNSSPVLMAPDGT